jgi:hypothetical protein
MTLFQLLNHSEVIVLACDTINLNYWCYWWRVFVIVSYTTSFARAALLRGTTYCTSSTSRQSLTNEYGLHSCPVNTASVLLGAVEETSVMRRREASEKHYELQAISVLAAIRGVSGAFNSSGRSWRWSATIRGASSSSERECD